MSYVAKIDTKYVRKEAPGRFTLVDSHTRATRVADRPAVNALINEFEVANRPDPARAVKIVPRRGACRNEARGRY